MAAVVIVATARLRDGLLDMLGEVAVELHEALFPGCEQEPAVGVARSHYVKARAIGDLLEDIGWVPDEISPPYTLDLITHAWAATTALQRVIARERRSRWRYAEIDEPEASGTAAGFRIDARHELRVILAACKRAKITITPPVPPVG